MFHQLLGLQISMLNAKYQMPFCSMVNYELMLGNTFCSNEEAHGFYIWCMAVILHCANVISLH